MRDWSSDVCSSDLGSVEVSKQIEKDALLAIVKKNENVEVHLNGKDIIKEIVVPQRLVNFVVK